MDDLKAIAGGNGGVGPGSARDDVTVVLDGDAVGLEGELGDEIGERGGWLEVGKGSVLAVEEDGEGALHVG